MLIRIEFKIMNKHLSHLIGLHLGLNETLKLTCCRCHLRETKKFKNNPLKHQEELHGPTNEDIILPSFLEFKARDPMIIMIK